MRALILLCFLPLCYCLFRRMQTVGVKGKFLCNREPATGVRIKLYDKGIFIDTMLDEVGLDNTGSFKISGSAKLWIKMNPRLDIYHRCDYKGACYKKFTMEIPKAYIADGEKVKQYFDIHSLELTWKRKGETEDCNNGWNR
ncbi:unnamed protein product [Cylicocyclus nassatus]|uniref:Transthyretin-like family protein n=1 Tax=Cylicocyclus nassatus TaxID=53992 RepID=A0AA36GMR1_CYLNA|nr:unnamed protein product [Cylicocyclus nassatus]